MSTLPHPADLPHPPQQPLLRRIGLNLLSANQMLRTSMGAMMGPKTTRDLRPIVAAAVAFALIGSTATPASAYDHDPQDPGFPEVSEPSSYVWEADWRDYGNGVRIQEGLYDTTTYRLFSADPQAQQLCDTRESRLSVLSDGLYRFYRGLVSLPMSENAPAVPIKLGLDFDAIPGDSYVVRLVGAPQEFGPTSGGWSLADVAAELKIKLNGVQIGSGISQLPPPTN